MSGLHSLNQICRRRCGYIWFTCIWSQDPAPLLIEVPTLRPELASTPAIVIALALWTRRRGVTPLPEDVSVGAIDDMQRPIDGAYVLALTRKHRVPLIDFPARIENEGSQHFAAAFDRLAGRDSYGLIMDLSPIRFITSRGLGVLLQATVEANLHCLQPRPAIARILSIVGADKALRIHRELPSALAACL